jgi:two-component system response regulator AtoC
MDYLLLGNHPSIQKIRELMTMVSDTAFNVLITGETGTGKEVVARLLHQASSRRDRTFVKVNCAALPLTLLESELFGYERGAFTGADKFKPGKFELASEGVMFLDEIGDMPLILQAKLLQVLQSGEFTRLGGTRDVKVNSWVISATNHELEEDMRVGRFREDLFYRLNIIKIEIPPLRERRVDLPILIPHFIQRHSKDLQLKRPFKIDPVMKKLFGFYHWPGNVRELSSIILKLMVGDNPEKVRDDMILNMSGDGIPLPDEFVPGHGGEQVGIPHEAQKADRLHSLKELKGAASDYIERKAILHALNMTSWNKKQAARMLKISYKALFYKMNNLGIEKKWSGTQGVMNLTR